MPIESDALAGLVGTELGPSDWLEIRQERIDEFADVTEDHQFIHVDPVAAARTPFSSTIAHGFLTLSLLTRLVGPLRPSLPGTVMGLNYGLERVRFLTPVKVGSHIRGRAAVRAVTERAPGRWVITYAVTIDIEGEERPALVADWLTMTVVE